jgi:hypothetical protein
MPKKQRKIDEAARHILKQAKLVAMEVARVEAIVDHAIGAAAFAMAAVGKSDSSELAESAKETLHVAKKAAAQVLQVAKREAEKALMLARNLAEERLSEADIRSKAANVTPPTPM